MTRRLIRATSTACLLLIGTTAMAQQPSNRHFSTEQQGRTDANSQASTSELEGISDEQHFIRYLTGKLALMNHGAIEMSNMAQEHAQAKEVQQFAEMLAQQHSRLNEQLQQFAPNVSDAVLLTGNAGTLRESGFRGELQGERRTDREQQIPEPQILETERDEKDLVTSLLRIDRNALQNYLDSSQKMLKQYEGQDFDMGFLGFQIGSHTWALAELDAMGSVGDEQFQEIVNDSRDQLKKHLQKAQQLAKQLEDDRNRKSSEESPAN